jgi:hypothetical protein
MPRIALAQGLSPQIKRGDAKYIEGLQLGDMFDDLTGTNFGVGPLDFTVVRADKPRFVEFYPRSEGGGIKDLNVPAGDPRTEFGPNGEPPAATKFYDFVVMLLPTRELIALSFKSSGLKIARQLNALMKLRGAASFAGRYTLTSVEEKNSKGEFYNFRVKNSSVVDEAASKKGWVSKEVYEEAAAIYEAIKDRALVIDREPGSDDTSFNTEEM